MAAENDIREAIASAISAVTGLSVSAYVPDQINPPCVYVIPGEVRYHQASQNGLEDKDFVVWGMVPLVASTAAQKQLGALRDDEGAGSLKEALETDRTLGGLVDRVTVRTVSPMQDYLLPNTQTAVLACTWNVGVMD